MKRFLPRLVAARWAVNATERFARCDVTRHAALARRTRAVTDFHRRADGQAVVPVEATLRLLREGIVDVCAVWREGQRPARVELLFGAAHVKARHFARR